MSNKLNIHFDRDFTVIPNQIFRDKQLSFKAKGLFCAIVSLDESWNFSIKGLAQIAQDKESSIKSAIKELEDQGYLTWERITVEGKFFVEIGVYLPEIIPYGKTSIGENPLWENVANKETNNKTSNENSNSTSRNLNFNNKETNNTSAEAENSSKVFEGELVSESTELATQEPIPTSKPNVWIDVWMDFMGVDPKDVSRREWKEIHKANKEIQDMGADIEALKLRMAQYSLSKTFSKCERTPNAIMRHWSRLGRAEDVTEHLNREQDYDRLAQRFREAAQAAS